MANHASYISIYTVQQQHRAAVDPGNRLMYTRYGWLQSKQWDV